MCLHCWRLRITCLWLRCFCSSSELKIHHNSVASRVCDHLLVVSNVGSYTWLLLMVTRFGWLRIYEDSYMVVLSWPIPIVCMHVCRRLGGGCDGTVEPSCMVDELLSGWRPLQWPVVLPSWKVVTWLILPVVICLSQRLSHASLSINKFILWNCERLIKSVIVYLMISYYMDNCGNSRANTCTINPDFWKGCIY